MLRATCARALRCACSQLRRIHREIGELEQRRALLTRPWEEQFLHWSRDGNGWSLHGRLVPPAHSPVRSVTPSGWCPRCTRRTP